MNEDKLRDIVSQFAIKGTVSKIEPLGAGLINEPPRVVTEAAD